MFNLLNKVLALEQKYGPHRDLKLDESATDYEKYEPLAICVTLRENYSDIVTISQWSELPTKLLASNTEVLISDKDQFFQLQKNQNKMECHICGSEYHFEKWLLSAQV